MIAKKDEVVAQTLLELNTKYEQYVDNLIETRLARDIPILTRLNISKTITQRIRYREDGETKYRNVSRSYPFVYQNYFYGKRADTITDALECSIVRGSEYRTGEPYAVEMNKAYNPFSGEDDIEALQTPPLGGDTCF